MQDAYCRDNKCWISSFNISKEGNTSRWCNFNYASDRCSNLRLYWVYSPRWPCACLHRQHRNGCRYWTKGSNLHSWHIATVWDPRKRLSLVVSPIWRYAADHPESFNVRIIAEILIPGSRCDWRPALLGQWAVSRKKSEQWRVKSEQKKQNKMRGAVSVEQWAENAKENNSFWLYRFARNSEQRKQQRVMHSGRIGISQIGNTQQLSLSLGDSSLGGQFHTDRKYRLPCYVSLWILPCLSVLSLAIIIDHFRRAPPNTMERENDFSIHRMRCVLKLRNSSYRHFILEGFDQYSIIFGVLGFQEHFRANPARKRSSPLTGQVTALFRSVAFLELLMSVPEKDVQRAASTSRRNFLLAPVIFLRKGT